MSCDIYENFIVTCVIVVIFVTCSITIICMLLLLFYMCINDIRKREILKFVMYPFYLLLQIIDGMLYVIIRLLLNFDFGHIVILKNR